MKQTNDRPRSDLSNKIKLIYFNEINIDSRIYTICNRLRKTDIYINRSYEKFNIKIVA